MKITIAGDFATVLRGEKAVENGSAFSSDIVRILEDSDVAIVNLESPVADAQCKPIDKIGPNLRTNRNAIKFLKESGVDVVTLANNHFFDYGEDGVRQTIECLCENKIQYVGGGRTEEEVNRILYIDKDNKKIAILNYCEEEFSVRDGIGSNHIDPIIVYHDIQEAKSKASFILVITHGGHEGYHLPSTRMQELYRFFIDAGANVVVNHHQHCFSGFEDYHDGKIFYGLGNFFFDTDYKIFELRKWHKGFLLQLSIENDSLSFDIIPYIQCYGDNVVVEMLTSKQKIVFLSNLKDINKIIVDKQQLQEANNEFYLLKNKNAGVVLSPYSNRFLRYLCKRQFIPSFLNKLRLMQLYNVMFCESHNELLKSFIKERQIQKGLL